MNHPSACNSGCSSCGCSSGSWGRYAYAGYGPAYYSPVSYYGYGWPARQIPAANWNRSGGASGYNAANFGLLRTVPDYSSYRRCWRDGPFYSGPCGPCASDCCNHGCGCNSCNHNCNSCGNHCGNNCGNGCGGDCCNDCCNDCCDDCCDHSCCDHGCRPPYPLPLPMPDEPGCPANATFVAGGPLTLAAGDNVTLSSINTETEGFIPTTSGIRIQNAGTYMVIYTLQIPVGEAVVSRFQLNLDGGNIASSAVDVTTSVADEETSSYTMHALIQAGENSLLNLTTLNPVTITTATAGGAAVVTLSIVQIC